MSASLPLGMRILLVSCLGFFVLTLLEACMDPYIPNQGSNCTPALEGEDSTTGLPGSPWMLQYLIVKLEMAESSS